MHGDLEITGKYDLATSVPYSISKAALNMAVAKYSAEYRSKGVLFTSIAPGATATFVPSERELFFSTTFYSRNFADYFPVSEREQHNLGVDMQRFAAHAPNFAGLASPADSVTLVRQVIAKANIDNGFGGAAVSQHGNKQWQ